MSHTGRCSETHRRQNGAIAKTLQEADNLGQQTSMPTALRIGPYRFFFVSLDRGEPPHVHVRRENKVAKLWLDPVVLERAGGFSRAELNALAKLVQEHRAILLERWYEFFGP